MIEKKFLPVLKNLPQDYEPYGLSEREGEDCSCGCIYFNPVFNSEDMGPDMDWGVCTNVASHRAGLLTFEHQGCSKFTRKTKDD